MVVDLSGLEFKLLGHGHKQAINTADNGGIWRTYLFPLLPIFASAATAVACALFGDWICFSMIVLGMVASGTSCWMIGTGNAYFCFPDPPPLPHHAGILIDEDQDQVVLIKDKAELSDAAVVSAIIHGRFVLKYRRLHSKDEDKAYHVLGISSCILSIQFLAYLGLRCQS